MCGLTEHVAAPILSFHDVFESNLMKKHNEENGVGFICYFGNLSAEEIDVINDYWLVTESGGVSGDFAYSVASVSERHGLREGEVRTIIKNGSGFYALGVAGLCDSCGDVVLVSSRMKYKEAFKGKRATCKKCLEEHRVKFEEECENKLVEYLESSSSVEAYEYSDLKYLDKVFLLAILTMNYAGDGPLDLGSGGFGWSGFKSIDAEALNSLVARKAVRRVEPMGSEAVMAYSRLQGGRSDKKSLIVSERLKDIPQPGFYINFSDDFSNINEFMRAVNDDVVEGCITIDDIESIRRLVNDVRVEKLYALVGYLGLNYRLKINHNIKLDAVLRHIAVTYPLDKAYYTMIRMVKDVIEYMHVEHVNSFATEHLFTRFLENYLSKVKTRGWQLKIAKSLPQEITSSNLEAMVTAIFLEGALSWDELSATEVAERWVSKLHVAELHG